jgi:hypothetical protein
MQINAPVNELLKIDKDWITTEKNGLALSLLSCTEGNVFGK